MPEPLFINANEPRRRFGLLKDTLAEVPNALANPLQTLDYGLSTVGRWARGNLQAKSQQISADPVEAALNFTGGGMRNVAAKAPQVFKGFTGLSTKLLEKLKGRSTVSRQYIDDLTNSPDLKQPERDLIRRVLGENKVDDVLPRLQGEDTYKKKVAPLDYGALDNDGRWDFQKMAAEHKVPTSKVYQLDVDINELPTPKYEGPINPDEMSSLSGQPAIKVVIDEKGKVTLADGNHRLDQAIEYGNTHIPAWVVDKRADQISVPDFANRVKTELLPLKRGSHKEFGSSGGHEGATLPDDLRGPVANYDEHVYESPIKTSAGGIHFEGLQWPNYFAHTRIEDLPAPKTERYLGDVAAGNNYVRGRLGNENAGDTRRIIEIQSDLFQKGRLENEVQADYNAATALTAADRAERITLAAKMSSLDRTSPEYKTMKARFDALTSAARKKKSEDISKLEPYRNTWHERIIREEVKQAAKDGKTKLQFPTGDTAMKIEGLGQGGARFVDNVGELTPERLTVGKVIGEADNPGGMTSSNEWIITDVLGDGKFKAVPASGLKDAAINKGVELEGQDLIHYAEHHFKDFLRSSAETFDISGKVDTSNPIYRFYEKEVGKYLINKYGAKQITDAQGVRWWEVDVKKDYKKLPIEAFGIGALPLMGERGDNKERRFKSEPLFIQQ